MSLPDTGADSRWARIVAHADMDAFYAAVEQLDDPGLRGRPVLVGSSSNRSVVLTASYEARPYRVGSAMPMTRARRLCPDAIIVPPRFARYQEASKTIMAVFGQFSPDVEAISLDEAFLDMSGAERLFGGPAAMGRKLKDAIRDATGGLTASVGISATKYVAKVASAHRKPDGLTIVPPGEATTWLAPFPVSRLWGVGPKTEARLHALGLRTIGDVAGADPGWLAENLGSAGAHFRSLARAEDPRSVDGGRSSKSIGSETTLHTDIADHGQLARHLRAAADKIGARLRRKGYLASGVRTKLKTAGFEILTRQTRLGEPTDVAGTLYAHAAGLLGAFEHPGPFRLVGMAAYDLVRRGEKHQLDLFSGGAERAGPARNRRLESAIDDLTGKFGSDVLCRADDLTGKQAANSSPNLDFLDDGEAGGG